MDSYSSSCVIAYPGFCGFPFVQGGAIGRSGHLSNEDVRDILVSSVGLEQNHLRHFGRLLIPSGREIRRPRPN